MTTYDFSRCSIMIVEDNVYIRNTFENLLRSFKFGKIEIANNGEEAIKYLKMMKQANNPGPDLIFSDLAMAPINGLMLLRWVRASKDCPNRMVPFLMISGAADRNYVNSARDLGVSEFIAKPFSVTSVYERFLEIIDYPRQFVTTQNYFGPDRRRIRKDTDSSGPERRVNSDDDAIIVYSADKKVKPKKPTDVWYWRLQNSLREKAAAGLGAVEIKGEIPMDLIEQAEKELERASFDFTIWALDYLGKLSSLCTEALMEPGSRSRHFGDIHDLALELRGQGGTFGYPLISTFGKMLYDITGEGCGEDDTSVEIVKSHIDSMRAVIREKIAGDGGEIGRELLKSLKMSIKKVDTIV